MKSSNLVVEQRVEQRLNHWELWNFIVGYLRIQYTLSVSQGHWWITLEYNRETSHES